MKTIAIIASVGAALFAGVALIYIFKYKETDKDSNSPTQVDVHQEQGHGQGQEGQQGQGQHQEQQNVEPVINGPQPQNLPGADAPRHVELHHEEIENDGEMPPLVSNASSSTGPGMHMDPLADVRFTLLVNQENKLDFENWPAAASTMRELSQNESTRFELVIDFPIGEISKYHTVEYLLAWLARVGDYIFARRILLVPNLAEVLRNPTLKPVTAENVTKFGCVLVNMGEERWAVSIRGLEEHPGELAMVVEEIFLRMIRFPMSIAHAKALSSDYISDWLYEFGHSLSDNQIALTNGFINSATYHRDMLERNRNAFLPLVYFENNFTCLTKFEIEKIKIERKKFLDKFNEKIVLGFIKDSENSQQNLSALVKAHYLWLIKRLVRWTSKVKLSDLILRSLFFSDRNDCKL